MRTSKHNYILPGGETFVQPVFLFRCKMFHFFFPLFILQYKYQVNVDGTVAAYRFPYLLLGDSLVLKQDSQYYEHFYTVLKPWKHYVPVKRSLEDLLEKIKWAKVSFITNSINECVTIYLSSLFYLSTLLFSTYIFCISYLLRSWDKRSTFCCCWGR